MNILRTHTHTHTYKHTLTHTLAHTLTAKAAEKVGKFCLPQTLGHKKT